MLYLGSFFLGWYKNYSDYWVWGVYSVSNIIQHAPWTRKISETISLFCLPFVNYFRLPPMPSVRRARQCTLFPGVKNCSKCMRTNFWGTSWCDSVTQLNRFKCDHQKSLPWLIIFGGQQCLLFSLQGRTHFLQKSRVVRKWLFFSWNWKMFF